MDTHNQSLVSDYAIRHFACNFRGKETAQPEISFNPKADYRKINY